MAVALVIPALAPGQTARQEKPGGESRNAALALEHTQCCLHLCEQVQLKRQGLILPAGNLQSCRSISYAFLSQIAPDLGCNKCGLATTAAIEQRQGENENDQPGSQQKGVVQDRLGVTPSFP